MNIITEHKFNRSVRLAKDIFQLRNVLFHLYRKIINNLCDENIAHVWDNGFGRVALRIANKVEELYPRSGYRFFKFDYICIFDMDYLLDAVNSIALKEQEAEKERKLIARRETRIRRDLMKEVVRDECALIVKEAMKECIQQEKDAEEFCDAFSGISFFSTEGFWDDMFRKNEAISFESHHKRGWNTNITRRNIEAIGEETPEELAYRFFGKPPPDSVEPTKEGPKSILKK